MPQRELTFFEGLIETLLTNLLPVLIAAVAHPAKPKPKKKVVIPKSAVTAIAKVVQAETSGVPLTKQ